jgi:hypothetical protein
LRYPVSCTEVGFGCGLQIDSVGGREGMFKELAERLPNDAPPDPAVMLEVLAKYDTRLDG